MENNINEKSNIVEFAPMEYCDSELEARWHELVCQILPHFENDETTLGMEWFIFSPETNLIEIYNWFDSEYSEGIDVLKFKQTYFGQYDWFPCSEAATPAAESNAVQLRVIKGGLYDNIKFVHVPELENLEWVEGCLNTAFVGELTNELALRKYMLGKIFELDVWQLLTLWGGENYDTVVGNDTTGKERTMKDAKYDFRGAVRIMA